MSLEKVLLEVYHEKLSEADAQEASVNLKGFVELLSEIYKSQEQNLNQSDIKAVTETELSSNFVARK
jgi:hypothetical protein